MVDRDDLKRAVSREAAGLIGDGMVLGLGTGSTIRYLLEAVATRRRRGELAGIVGIPTSEDTRVRATGLGIPLSDLANHPRIDLALDGADEVDPRLDLIKGLGGALLREKIVVTAAASFVVLVDESKRVPRLGSRAPVPVEVDPFSVGVQGPFLRRFGCEPRMRLVPDGSPYRTDGGHLILDCYFDEGIPDPRSLAAELDSRPGIIEHGLFLDCAERVLVAAEGGVEVLERSPASLP